MLTLVQSRIQSYIWALNRGTGFQKHVQTCIVERLYQIDYATLKAFGSSSETHRPVTVMAKHNEASCSEILRVCLVEFTCAVGQCAGGETPNPDVNRLELQLHSVIHSGRVSSKFIKL